MTSTGRDCSSNPGTQQGLCQLFPREVAEPQLGNLWDRMWGLECVNSSEDRSLQQIGKRVCGLCPIQCYCLAVALVGQYQSGIFGGLSYKTRKALRRIIKNLGQEQLLESNSPKPLSLWLQAHPEVIEEARKYRQKRTNAVGQQQLKQPQQKEEKENSSVVLF